MDKLLKVSQQTFWQVLAKVITSISGFIVISTISRTYGQSGTGDFTLSLIYIGFFYVLVDFSFNAHILTRLHEQTAEVEWRKLLGTRLAWAIFLVIIYFLILTILPFKPPSFGFSLNFKLAAAILALNVILDSFIATAEAFFQARLKYEYDSTGSIIGALAGTILIVYLAITKQPIFILVSGYVLSWFVNAFISAYFVKRFTKNLSPIFDLTYIKTLFKQVWPLAATLLLNVVYFRGDAFILSYYKSSSEVGIYNVAYQVFQALLVLPTYIMNSFYPIMLETLKIKIDKFVKQIGFAFVVLFIISILIGAGLYILAPHIIEIIAGENFTGSIISLQILSFSFPAFFLSALGLWVMVAKKRYKLMMLVYGVGLIFNLSANLILIPTYSYIAASWITGISEYLILILQITILFKEIRRASP